MKKYFLSLFLLSSICLAIFPADFVFDANKIPNPVLSNSWTVDLGNYITGADKDSINALIDQIEKDTSAEISVVIVPNTNGDIFSAAQALFDKWKIGKKGKDNGILLLISMEERQFRTHTGYGIEGILPDATCLQLQEQYIVPNFRAGNFAEGIRAYLKIIFEILKDPDYLAEQERLKKEQEQKEYNEMLKNLQLRKLRLFLGTSFVGFMFFLIGLVILILSIGDAKIKLRESMRSYSKIQELKIYGLFKVSVTGINFMHILSALVYLAGSKFLGKWQALPFILPGLGILATLITDHIFRKIELNIINIWRNHPRDCPECAKRMTKLDDNSEDAHLSKGQIKEESIESKDYDVWQCAACKTTTIEAFDGKSYYLYTNCPKCESLTAKETGSKTIKEATYSDTGEKEVSFHCLNCEHDYTKMVTISKLYSYSYSSGGSSSSSSYSYSSSHSSSSYSSHSSSSSSSSSSSRSFGGGSSGGGGATSSW
jgi:uncharacterized protein